jgi:hypothetical protein
VVSAALAWPRAARSAAEAAFLPFTHFHGSL